MEVPQTRLITVKSAVLSTEDLEDEERILQQVENRQPSRQRRESITVGMVVNSTTNSPDITLEVSHRQNSATESIQRAPSDTANIFIVEVEAPTQDRRARLGDLAKANCLALHSTSTTLAEDDGRGSSVFGVAGNDGVSQILDWFKSLLTQASKNGKVTLKDMKEIAKDYVVSHANNNLGLGL